MMRNLKTFVCLTFVLTATVSAQNPPVLSPQTSSRPGTTNPPTTDRTMPRRSGQIARPASQAVKQPEWPSGSETPDLPGGVSDPEASARSAFESAMKLIHEGKAEDAVPILKKLAVSEPKRFEVHYLLGLVFVLTNDPGPAADALRKAISLNERSAAAYSLLCAALSGSGKRFEAIDACREAVRLAPGVQRFKIQLAGMYVQADQAAEAVRFLEAVNAEQVEIAHLGTLADAYYLNGEYSKAAGIYATISKRWPDVSLTYLRLSGVYDYLERAAEANAAAKKFAELEPKLAISHFNLGVRLQSSGLFFESIDSLLKAIDLDRTNGMAYLALSESYETVGDNDNLLGSLRHAYKYLPVRSFELCYRLGTLLGESGSHAEAIEPLEQAFEMKPVPQVMRSLGLAYVAGGDYEKGVDLIEKANEISPLPPGMTMNFNRERRKQALARFDEIVEEVKRNPESIQAHSAAHEVYLFKYMTKEAERHGLEIIRLHPENYNSYNAMGIFYSNNGEIEKALAMTQKAIELKPHHVLYITASFHLKKLGRLDEAIEALRKSIAIKPLPETPLLLGDLLLKKGNRQEALKEFQAGLQLAPNDPRPHFRLAWLYIRMGDREGAVRHYRTLKTLTPHMTESLEMCIRATFGSLN